MQKFSIILPVRNGGSYVKDCVQSILSQTCTDFNLIVLDNASTDGTLEWIRSLHDDRIVLHSSARPLSIEQNWARIAGIPKNEFMTCIGHDDLLLPGYLETMNNLIHQFPAAGLYQTHFNFIDAEGKIIRKCRVMDEVQTADGFLEKILSMQIDVNGTGFMTRSKDYEAMGGIPLYPNLLFADFTLWLDISRLSGKVTSPENGFSYRLHQSMTTTSPDEKFHHAFECFVQYLYALKRNKADLNTVINKHAITIISFYCKSFSHRLLRTDIKLRNNLTVTEWTEKCDSFANLLIDNNSCKPSSAPSVQLARLIDSNAAGRKLFLLFKKIYSKPVL